MPQANDRGRPSYTPEGVDIPLAAQDNGFENAFSQVIEKSDLQPLNDPNCTHEKVVREEGDCGIPDHVAYTCKDCPVGFIVKE
jgi:hypothetical protein